jgi:hypothetical protein
MTKRIFAMVGLLALMVLMTGVLTAAAQMPNPSIQLVAPEELKVLNDPEPPIPTLTMNVGDTLTVRIQVQSDSNQEFISAMALPSFQFPGKGVVAVQGGDHAGSGTSATLEVTFEAKGPTARMPGGVAPVYVVVGVRYGGGFVATQQYLFNVAVP